MSRAVVILYGSTERKRVAHWAMTAPTCSRVELKQPQRTLPQNDRMWAMLTDVARQLDWHGMRYSPDDWKDFFMHALRQARWMPAEDGGMIPIGMRTSDLGVGEMGELMDLMEAFGARHGVTFSGVEPDTLTRQRESA